MKLCLALLALVLVAQASGTRDAADVQARSVPYLAVPGDRHGLPDWCHVQCYGDNSTKHGESYECWGTFKVWCAKDDRRAAAAAAPAAVAHDDDDDSPARFFGFFCKGHFLTTHMEDGRRLALCEGGSSSIRGHIARCPYTRKTYRSMEGSWNLGTASSLMTHPRHDNDTDTDDDSPTAPPAAGVQQVLRDMDMDELVQQLRKNAAAASDAGNDTDTEYSFEGRGQGLSGEWRATKVISEDEYAAGPLTAEQAQAVEREMIDPQWADWMPKSLTSTGGCNKNKPGSNGLQGGSHHGDFEVLCNGRSAWLRGAAPCWGKFEVSGEWRRDDSSATNTADSMTTTTTATPAARRALRQLVTSQLGVEKTMRHDVSAATVTTGAADTEAAATTTTQSTTPRLGYNLNSASMDAECNGLWSGALGRTCYGLNTAHLELEGPWGELSKWSICSGKQGIRFTRRANAWGMSTACKGRAVTHVSIMPNDDDDDDDQRL